MLVMAIMTLLCTAGVAFYLRFLGALCRESKSQLIGYWIRLRLDSGENAVTELHPQKSSMTRAA